MTTLILNLSSLIEEISDKPDGQGFQPRASLGATCPDRGCASLRDLEIVSRDNPDLD